jgi:hypothetical protein
LRRRQVSLVSAGWLRVSGIALNLISPAAAHRSRVFAGRFASRNPKVEVERELNVSSMLARQAEGINMSQGRAFKSSRCWRIALQRAF